MIKLNNVTIKTNKGRLLVDNLTLTVNNGDKLAIIGEEGNGKSTLLKAIYNKATIDDYCSVSGSIDIGTEQLGYLKQKLEDFWLDYTVVDYLLTNESDMEMDYSVFEKFGALKAYLNQLNITSLLDNNPKIATLSGGERVKLQLFKVLLTQPTALLLDEPTNDLDIETLSWLEQFINNYNNPIVFISHDELLLEKCANQILHLEQLIKKFTPKHTWAKTGYLQYVSNRQQNISKQTQIALNERREKAKKEAVLNLIKQKVETALNKAIRDPIAGRLLAKKMANVKAQEAKFEKKVLTEIPEVEEAIKVVADLSVKIPPQKQILNLHLDKLSVDKKLLSKDINLKIFGCKKIAIIGNNGVGKTTLIKHILSNLKTVSGIKVGYFSQNYFESLNYNNTPVEELTAPNTNFNVRTFLGSIKFTLEEMNSPISNLSEGQKAKLLLLKLIVESNNVLLLDEPTRNLSPLSKPVIRSLLKAFKGTIITVSHDRCFIVDVCDQVCKLTPVGLMDVKKESLLN